MRGGTSLANERVIGRIGLAAVFGGFGIWELTQPTQWSGYVPPFLGPRASGAAGAGPRLAAADAGRGAPHRLLARGGHLGRRRRHDRDRARAPPDQRLQ